MPIRVVFGAKKSGLDPANGDIHVATPMLLGSGVEDLVAGPQDIFEQSEHHFISESEGWLSAAYVLPIRSTMADTAHEAYQRVLRDFADAQLVRIWNFVPGINEEVDGLENYRAFCLGRHEAFVEHFGARANEQYCSASAVGVDDDCLVVNVLGTHRRALHQENPLQEPAYNYPERYGPRPPCFSRASYVPGESPALYISGTASVRGSESISPGDLAGQLKVTGENLDRIIAESVSSLGQDIKSVGQAYGRAYVRHPEHMDAVMACIDEHAWCTRERTNIVRSDICRSELLVEIELSWPAVLT
ncbi:hypothetical protein [Cerasicoccus fimbriatus]|uniref:chorismate transformation enzyme, FkbO/Hyg5 family n=1 Tax=Cerasicoccus fimbriatus TaxID=3014554 RepID=UPI0022B4BB1B|nr:hypothetical protein [Cerasicoccus sp. TK19100]